MPALPALGRDQLHTVIDLKRHSSIGTRQVSRVECALTNAGDNKLMTSSGLEAGIGRGLEFLRRSQLPSGEFKVYMSPNLNLERDCVFDSSPFPTALIAYALGFADTATAGDILDKALAFLLSEMEGPGLWRYWTKRHQSH